MVKKAITNLDSSKASGPICIPVIVLKNCEPELSYKLAELYIGMSHRWSLLFKNVGDKSTAKNYGQLVLFLWLVNWMKDL